jgi:hypothetical protein
MRRTPRPFVTEFKSRGARSTPPRAREEAADAPAPPPRPAFHEFDFSPSAPAPADYEAAMRAADALFSSRVQVATPIAEQPPTPQPSGRILPSLIEEPAVVAPAREEEAPRRRGRKRILDKLPPVRRLKRKQAKAAALEAFEPDDAGEGQPAIVAPPVAAPAAHDGAPQGERRALRKRHKLDAKLKRGERWKRRLCLVAR